MRFSPIQTELARELCKAYDMPLDLSTAVLFDNHQAYKRSAAILNMFPYMGFPFTILGPVALCIPSSIRDAGYSLFARNRGQIWKFVKRVTGMGDTLMHEHRDKIVGLEEPLDPSWGFGEDQSDKKKK